MKQYLSGKLILIIVFALILGFLDLPGETQQSILPVTPTAVTKNKIHLGLDLQGGTQLDYKIDLRKVPAADQESIVEGVKEVINKRVNGLGVSEPNIYSSHIADEQHIIVELAGIKDIEEAKTTVGKTIQLEFKEPREEIEPDKREKIRSQAQAVLDKLLHDETLDFNVVAEEEKLAYPSRVEFLENTEFKFQDELVGEITEKAFAEDIISEMYIPELVETIKEDNDFGINALGQFAPRTGFSIYKVTEKEEVEREIEHEKKVRASHILIAHEGAERADPDITRTEEEARIRAEEVLEKVKAGNDFSELSEEYSDDVGSKVRGGDLDFFTFDMMVEEFSNAAFALEINGISDLVKSAFGYHIIKVTDILSAYTETKVEPRVKLARLFYSTAPDPWKETGLTGEHFVRADVEFDNLYSPYVSIKFNDEGGNLFEEITERNISKQVAIFVGGELISAPRVNEKISGGSAQITGNFTLEEATNLARDLNTGAIPAPIVLSGQYTIGATLGAEALSGSLRAGILGLLVLAIFMMLYYRLPGLLAVIALSMYAIMLMFLIKIAIPLPVAIVIAAIIFVAILTKILQSNESGWEKFIAFILDCFILFFITFLLSTPVVLTLAGVAGIILSIGMAVDANILIFERIKEELQGGRPVSAAIETGFERAWSSIRDSNFSSLITCGILFYFGTSIIQGFALNLAMGILISIITAITITRTLLRTVITTPWGSNLKWLGVKKNHSGQPSFGIIAKSKSWFAFSGILIGISLLATLFFGLRLGIDFTGGTLLEVQFENLEISAEDIRGTLKELEGQSIALAKEMVAVGEAPTESPETTDTVEETPLESEETTDKETDEEKPPIPVEKEELTKSKIEPTELIASKQVVELGSPLIIPTDHGTFIIRTKHIDNETHTLITKTFQEKLGNFEEPRFTTIGPTIGKTLKKKAVYALGITLIMIVLYIAFAFRRIPKRINPWRFGFCAIAALTHDIIITIGVFVILGRFLNVEIDALFITALLTIMGFSVHDTIVVFDRIRENLKLQERGETFDDITNKALNQTLARSINTSVSTLFTIVALFIFGAASIKPFVFALIVGTVIGTYSSIFTASPLLAAWQKYKRR